MTLVTGGFEGCPTFILTRTFQESVLGWVIRVDRNSKMREKVNEAGWATRVLSFVENIKAGWEFLKFWSMLSIFFYKMKGYLTHRRSQPSMDRKCTCIKFLLSTKYFILIVHCRISHHGTAVKNPTSVHEDASSIPDPAQWVKIQRCHELCIGCTHGSNPANVGAVA